MSEHTPTPWHTGSTEHTELVMGFKDNSECVLAELDTDDVSMEETAANAAFIVKAVNNHAPMLEMLVIARKMVAGEIIEHAVIDTQTRQSLGDALDVVINAVLITEKMT